MDPEEILLTPYEKWKYHRIIPYQFIVHLFMLVIVTFFALTANSQHAAFARRMNLNWYNYFIGDVEVTIDDTRDPNSGPNLLYNVDEFLDSLSSIVDNYYNIKNESLTKVNYHAGFEPDEGYKIEPLRMTSWEYRSGNKLFDPVVVPDFTLDANTVLLDDSGYLGPYDVDTHGYNAVKDRLHLTKLIEVEFTLTSFDLAAGYRTCSTMALVIKFDNSANGPFTMTFESEAKAGCEGDAKYPDSRSDHVIFFWLPNVAMFVAAIAWLMLIVHGSVQDIRWYVYILRKKKKRIVKRLQLEITPDAGDENGTPASAPWFPTEAEIEQAASVIKENTPEDQREKWIMRFPSMKSRKPAKNGHEKPKLCRVLWKIYRPVLSQRFAFMNSACAFCCALLSIVNFSVGAAGQFVVGPTHKFLLGICVAFVWASLLTWAANNHGYFVIVKTLRRGIPRVAAFTAGVFPIFMAYTLFGMIYFGDHSGRFGTVVSSMVSLFAIMNGDIVRESYLDLMSTDYFVGQLYLYSFICFFIYVVLAVFVVMMEKSYEFITLEPEDQAEAAYLPADASPRSMSLAEEKIPDLPPLSLPSSSSSVSVQQSNMVLEVALTASYRSLAKELLAQVDVSWASSSQEDLTRMLAQILEIQGQVFKAPRVQS